MVAIASTAIQRNDVPVDSIGVAVVGCGYWGPNLVRNFFDTTGCRVVGVCDASVDRLTAVQQRHPSLTVMTDFEEVLCDPTVDAVAIATPADSHASLARRALLAGKHVLIEKPMTTSVADAEMLVDLACRRNLTLMVDHTFVYTGAVRKIKDLIDTGELGRMYYYDSVRVNLGFVQRDVSVIWDLAAHDLSIMNFLLAEQPRSVSAIAATHLPGGMADVAYLTVVFDNELIAHFHVNWLSPVKVRQVLIGGDRRMVLYDDIEPVEKVKVYDRGVCWNANPKARDEAMVAYRLGDMSAPVLNNSEALRTECSHFIDCIRTGQTPLTGALSGLQIVKQLEAAERSAQHGGAMQTL